MPSAAPHVIGSRAAEGMPRPEHPRPQFERSEWRNLNGEWTFELDPGKTGVERGLPASRGFATRILVPFCPESVLSGVGNTDFMEMLWYHRVVAVPSEWRGRRILLHFGGVDFETEVYVDGKLVGSHWGGSASFEVDVSRHMRPGASHHLVLRVRDETRSRLQPAGKQSPQYRSFACFYTRTSGIWQTVWLEAAAPAGPRDCFVVPDLDGARFVFIPRFHAAPRGLALRVTVTAGGAPVGHTTAPAGDGVPCVVDLPRARPWSPKDPFLYDILYELLDPGGTVIDTVKGYAGLRKIHVEGNRLYLNNSPLYLRMVLDQGFYPDGIWTAPTDEALRRDIELSMKAGFNGARLHQKVFEERFHYWADRLGYLTWGESASWGADVNTTGGARGLLAEWRRIVTRDRSHPSIIAWSPFNETGNVSDPREHHRTHVDAYDLTRDLDPTRPVNDASGYVHVKTDLWTVHNYTQDPVKLRADLKGDPVKGVFRSAPDKEAEYAGQPYFVDEYGGIKWIPPDRGPHAEDSWGYGEGPGSLDEYFERLEALTAAIHSHPHISGYCYTQLTDVEQEQNGIYTYDRREKFDMGRIASIFGRDPGVRGTA